MQAFKSNKNLEIDQKLARRLEKQRGEVPFDIESNYSAHIVVTFPKEYTTLPAVWFTPVVSEGSEFDVNAILSNRTKKDFTINVQNTSQENVKGYLMWFSE
jgi:hypothetical protein